MSKKNDTQNQEQELKEQTDSQFSHEVPDNEEQGAKAEEKQAKSPEPQEEQGEEYREKYLRLLAENENLLKRLRKESKDSIRLATQKIILDLLLPLDQFENALMHANTNPSEDVQNWALGFKMIQKQFKEWLSSQNVHSYVSRGELFNPALHEAVEMIASSEYREGIVIKELVKGYKMGDYVLRPAKVVVAKAPTPSKESQSDAEDAQTNAETEQEEQRPSTSTCNNKS